VIASGTPRAVIDRARAYLNKVPHAVSGQGGHDATFRAACALIQGFALPEHEALQLLAEWNAHCQPPWSEAELRHKIQDAMRKPSAKPQGYLLNRRDHSAQSGVLNREGPDVAGFHAATPAELRELNQHRYYREALEWASIRGVLVFGDWHGQQVYGVTDQTKRVLEIRRVDGKPFPPHGSLVERKSHAIRGSDKTWPVGILEAAPAPAIALVEGIPDFLTAHYVCLWEQASHHAKRDTGCVPVSMLSGSPRISEDAVNHFKGKHVRIFPHPDKTGLQGAARWQEQLTRAGARVDVFDFSRYERVDNQPVKDLEDFELRLAPRYRMSNPGLWRIMP
jgi:hypothetical protein